MVVVTEAFHVPAYQLCICSNPYHSKSSLLALHSSGSMDCVWRQHRSQTTPGFSRTVDHWRQQKPQTKAWVQAAYKPLTSAWSLVVQISAETGHSQTTDLGMPLSSARGPGEPGHHCGIGRKLRTLRAEWLHAAARPIETQK